MKLCLGPRLRRIESALRADPDLFGGTELYPEFKVDSLLRADTAERYAAYVAARQAGWLSSNEIRELENYPAVDGGDNVQQTPVGGAPNPTTET
jgi:phage portal protein BeeE